MRAMTVGKVITIALVVCTRCRCCGVRGERRSGLDCEEALVEQIEVDFSDGHCSQMENCLATGCNRELRFADEDAQVP